MSPISLPRMRGVRLEELRESTAGYSRRCMRSGARAVQSATILLLPVALVLASSQARHWLGEAFATVCVVGGFLAAPILTLSAWIGLALPESVPLHRASTALFLIAIIWMALALIGAHLHHHKHVAHDE